MQYDDVIIIATLRWRTDAILKIDFGFIDLGAILAG